MENRPSGRKRHGALRRPGRAPRGGQEIRHERQMSVTVADIEAARRTIAGQVLRTPMLPAPKLSALTGADVHVKYENLQVTNSFKDRGALNKLASLDAAARARGRHRHVRRQPRPGGRLPRRAAGNPGHHRDAGDHAVREGRGDAGARRRGRARGRERGGGAGARANACRASAASPSSIPTTIRW